MPHDSHPAAPDALAHGHVFLGASHRDAERRSWAVIWLCTAMMGIEIVGGLMFGSIALVADGLHMSTHAGALLLAALAYRFARQHAEDPRFSFGTGKFGDLAGFTSAIILGMIALLIAYEALGRLFQPVPIHFAEALPIACLGLAVNLASAFLLGFGAGHHHGHSHGHSHDHDDHDDHDHDRHDHDYDHDDHDAHDGHDHDDHARVGRDNNFRAAIVHVAADAFVSVLVIIGLLLARSFGWVWMDPLAGLIGAAIIASWAVGLIRDTGGILLDMNAATSTTRAWRKRLEAEGDQVLDLHLWRLGPGHLGAILSVRTRSARGSAEYRAMLAGTCPVSHWTIEIERQAA